jgi:tetratricopeptide (TPR) repeat protein
LASLSEIDALGGRVVQAKDRLKEAIDIAQKAEDRHGEAHLLVKLAVLAAREENYAEARPLLNQAGALFANLGDDRGGDEVRRLLGSVLVGLGEYSEAEALLRESLAQNRVNLASTNEAAVLAQLSVISEHSGDLAGARQQAAQALKIFQEKRDRVNEVNALQQLANISFREEAYIDAVRYCLRALAISEQIGNNAIQSHFYYSLGLASHKLGRSIGGAHLMGIAVLLDEQMGKADASETRHRFERLAEEAGFGKEEQDQILSQAAHIFNSNVVDGLVTETLKGIAE